MDIKNLSDKEIEHIGYNLYERREQLSAELQQINQNLLLIRNEKNRRLVEKQKKQVKKNN